MAVCGRGDARTRLSLGKSQEVLCAHWIYELRLLGVCVCVCVLAL